MLTKSQIQLLRSLHDKAGRQESGCFLVEGKKGILEFLKSDFEIVEGFFTEKFVSSLQSEWQSAEREGRGLNYSTISASELDRITTLKSNDAGALVVKIPKREIGKASKDELVLVLDSINDPGNLGTIIRTADWYGVKHIICSTDTVDCYNPKVVIATMGSLTRVSVSYIDLDEYLSGAKGKIYGAYLDGESIHKKSFTTRGGYLVIGSESHGISPKLEQYITDRITIPRIGGAESLNAGVATAIMLDNFTRK